MPSTPSGIWYPDGTSPTNITTLMSTMASSIESVLSYSTKPPINFVANITARAALATSYAPTATKPLFVWRQDAAAGRNLEVTVNGTNWFPVPQAGQGGYAYASAAGAVTMPAVPKNTASTAVAVTFPTGRFAVAPVVQVTGTNARLTCLMGGVTVTGFNAYVANWTGVDVTGTSTLHWTATQMTPTTAAG